MSNSNLIRAFELRDLHQTAQWFDSYRQFYERLSDSVLANRFIRARAENAESVVLVADQEDGTLDVSRGEGLGHGALKISKTQP